jgi:serine/threonine-protein kinase HipA
LLSDKRAEEIKDEMIKAVSNWRKVAAKYKVSPSEIERKARAFRV